MTTAYFSDHQPRTSGPNVRLPDVTRERGWRYTTAGERAKRAAGHLARVASLGTPEQEGIADWLIGRIVGNEEQAPDYSPDLSALAEHTAKQIESGAQRTTTTRAWNQEQTQVLPALPNTPTRVGADDTGVIYKHAA